ICLKETLHSSTCSLLIPQFLTLRLMVLPCPATAGLHAPLEVAGPEDWQKMLAAKNRIGAMNFIGPCYHFCFSSGGVFFPSAPYVTELPSPVTAGLFSPDVVAAPETRSPGGAACSSVAVAVPRL